jgi:hypothetical protein
VLFDCAATATSKVAQSSIKINFYAYTTIASVVCSVSSCCSSAATTAAFSEGCRLTSSMKRCHRYYLAQQFLFQLIENR